eukprot:5743942-Amphidinium_carterae.1
MRKFEEDLKLLDMKVKEGAVREHTLEQLMQETTAKAEDSEAQGKQLAATVGELQLECHTLQRQVSDAEADRKRAFEEMQAVSQKLAT